MRLLLVLSLMLNPSHALVGTAELDAEPERFDDREVTIRGEIIGDYGYRADDIWIQINDDTYADTPLLERGEPSGTNTGIGVRLPTGTVDEAWGPPGGYRVRGPIVEVTGVFHHADPERGGDTYMDATAVRLIEPARPIAVPGADPVLLAMAAFMVILGGGLWARARWRKLNPEL